jgi:hypothetical protein
VVSNRAARHRRGRPTPAAPVVDEFDAFDEDELLYVLVDYHRSPLRAWTAILVPDGLEPVALQATSAHDAFHKATELIEVLSEHADVGSPPCTPSTATRSVGDTRRPRGLR